MEVKVKKMIIAVCILSLAAFSAAASGASEQEIPEVRTNQLKAASPPPIDMAVHESVETATFGLG